jgi:hypothetical protein
MPTADGSADSASAQCYRYGMNEWEDVHSISVMTGSSCPTQLLHVLQHVRNQPNVVRYTTSMLVMTLAPSICLVRRGNTARLIAAPEDAGPQS